MPRRGSTSRLGRSLVRRDRTRGAETLTDVTTSRTTRSGHSASASGLTGRTETLVRGGSYDGSDEDPLAA